MQKGADRGAYESQIRPLMDTRCMACHDGSNPHLVNLNGFDNVKKVTERDTARILKIGPESTSDGLKVTELRRLNETLEQMFYVYVVDRARRLVGVLAGPRFEISDELVLSVLAAIHEEFGAYEVFMTSTGDMLIVAARGDTLPRPDWSVALPASAELPQVIAMTPERLEALPRTHLRRGGGRARGRRRRGLPRSVLAVAAGARTTLQDAQAVGDDVVTMDTYVVETERRFYLANHVDLQARSADGEIYFDLTLNDAWVWDVYRSARFVKTVRVITFKDVNVEELVKGAQN